MAPSGKIARWDGNCIAGRPFCLRLRWQAMGGREEQMRKFWNARAREDAFFFVDDRQSYRSPDPARFWTGEEAVEYLLGELDVRVRGTDTVLEIGCGLGRITRVLAARARHVVALDISEEMLARARHHNPDLDNVEWLLGDGVSLAGVPDGSVDACASVVVLQHMPDPALTLGYVREVGRTLRPAGWAALQVSNNLAGHRGWVSVRHRVKALAGRAPRGLTHPAWIGSPVELDALRDAAQQGGMTVERVCGAGSQFCQVLLRKTSTGTGTPSA
jgi:SAM-dependent methyltransferase